MKKFITNFLMLALIGVTMGSVVSCKDHDDSYNDIKQQMNEPLQKAVEEQKEALKEIQEKACDCETKLKDYLTKAEAAELFELLEKYKELEELKNTIGDVDTSKGTVAEQLATLDQKIQEAIALINQLKCDCDKEALKQLINDLTSRVETLEANYITLGEKVDQAIADAADAKAAAVAAQATADANAALIAALTDDFEKLKDEVLTPLIEEVLKLRDDVDDLKAAVATAQNTADEAKNNAAAAQATADAAQAAADAAQTAAQNAMTQALKGITDAAAAQATADAASTTANNALTNAATAQAAAEAAQSTADAAQTAADNAQTAADAAKAAADAAQTTADQAKADAATAQTTAEAAQTAADNAKAAADAAQAAADAAQATADAAKDAAAAAQTTADEAKAAAATAQATADAAKDKADANEIKIGQLEEQLKNYYTKPEVDEMLQKVNDAIQAVNDRVTELKEYVDNLYKNLMEKMVTGIIIQGAQSPVIGYFNTPFDARSLILAAYYGQTEVATDFPSTSSAAYLESTDINRWTPRNLQVMGITGFDKIEGYIDLPASTMLVAQKNGKDTGNAGTLYVTVNPNTVNFKGVTLDMETSQGNASPIVLSPLRASDRELSFTYRRAAGNNGFYEADATLTKNQIENAKFSIDYKTLGQDAKAILEQRTKSSILTLGTDLIKAAKDINLPAYAVKANWEDANNETHSVFSQYGIATTAIKPLSYAFMKDYKIKQMPGLDRLNDLVDKIMDKINIKLKLDLGLDKFANLGTIEFKRFELITTPQLTQELKVDFDRVFSINDFINATGDFYDPETGGTDRDEPAYIFVTNFNGQFAFAATDNDGSVHLMIYDTNTSSWRPASESEQEAIGFGAIEAGQTVTISIHEDFTETIQQTLNDLIESINNGVIADARDNFGPDSPLARTITDLLNDVKDLGKLDDKINGTITDAVNDAKNNVRELIDSYMTKINNRFVKYFNSAHKAMYITMVGSSNSKIGLLSQSKKRPTKVSGELTLVPTSYNLELLAPAYKKFVAVTDVFKASDKSQVALGTAKTLAANANKGTNMFRVIDSEKTCKMSGQSGYVYEITYTAIDYHGKVMIKKFYVQF